MKQPAPQPFMPMMPMGPPPPMRMPQMRIPPPPSSVIKAEDKKVEEDQWQIKRNDDSLISLIFK